MGDGTIGLLDLPPNPRQKEAALAVVAALVLTFAAVAPFAATPLPEFAAFNPVLDAMIVVADLITALLLFAHFSLWRSRALLVLAGGYLFSALIVVPHALTYPGAFGVLGADIQAAPWLYRFWRFGFAVALLLYVLLKDDKTAVTSSTPWTVGWTVAIIATLVCALSWISTAGRGFMPDLLDDATHASPAGRYGVAFDLLVCAAALVFLWIRRRSVLDLWLIVVACGLLDELSRTAARFSLGFYASRFISLATATIVLIVLLAETTKLYARLAEANTMLQRERDNKLMNLEAVVAAISHELKQPLSAILLRGGTALRLLEHKPPNLEKLRSAIDQILGDGRRAKEIFNNLRELFNATKGVRMSINVNEMILDMLNLLRDELKKHNIATRTELAPKPKFILGHKGQLQEVLLNLIHNAIEAMDTVKDRSRALLLKTEDYDGDAVMITIEDTGPGIASEELGAIFEAFVTTKPQGTGLGLAICRMIIERHGGQLVAETSNKGAVFQVILPVEASSEARKPPSDRDQVVKRNALLPAK